MVVVSGRIPPAARFDVPVWREGGRVVTLSNQGTRFKRVPLDWANFHLADWVGRIDGVAKPPSFSDMAEALFAWSDGRADKKHQRREQLSMFVDCALSWFVGQVPHATELQRAFEGRSTAPGLAMPTGVVSEIHTLVERYFPGEEEHFDVWFEGVLLRRVPIRALAALYVTGLVCEEINRGDAWARNHASQSASDAICAGAFMATTHFWMRLKTTANSRQAQQCCRQQSDP